MYKKYTLPEKQKESHTLQKTTDETIINGSWKNKVSLVDKYPMGIYGYDEVRAFTHARVILSAIYILTAESGTGEASFDRES